MVTWREFRHQRSCRKLSTCYNLGIAEFFHVVKMMISFIAQRLQLHAHVYSNSELHDSTRN